MACKFLSGFVNNIPERFWFLQGVPKIRDLVLPWHVAVQLDLPVWFLCKNALFPNQRCPSYGTAAPSKTKPETKLILYCAQLVHNPDKPVTVLKNRTGKQSKYLDCFNTECSPAIPNHCSISSKVQHAPTPSWTHSQVSCLLLSKTSTQLHPGCVLLPLHCWCYYGDFYRDLPNLP